MRKKKIGFSGNTSEGRKQERTTSSDAGTARGNLGGPIGRGRRPLERGCRGRRGEPGAITVIGTQKEKITPREGSPALREWGKGEAAAISSCRKWAE